MKTLLLAIDFSQVIQQLQNDPEMKLSFVNEILLSNIFLHHASKRNQSMSDLPLAREQRT